VAEWQTR